MENESSYLDLLHNLEQRTEFLYVTRAPWTQNAHFQKCRGKAAAGWSLILVKPSSSLLFFSFNQWLRRFTRANPVQTAGTTSPSPSHRLHRNNPRCLQRKNRRKKRRTWRKDQRLPAEPTNRSPSWAFFRRNELGPSPSPLGSVNWFCVAFCKLLHWGEHHATFSYVRYLAYCVSKPSGLVFCIGEKFSLLLQ